MKKSICLLCVSMCVIFLYANEPLDSGLDAYARSDWSSAILSFRKAATASDAGAEPWYWLVMAELSAEKYDVALQDMERFFSSFPDDARVGDILYQKGRVLYLSGNYEQSITTFYQFITKWPDHSMIASAYYWVGECLYAVGRYEEARTVFNLVLEKYPQGIKREAAQYRVALIDQTDKEDELIKLLKISHEESLKIIEDYQRREKTYEQAISTYQKRIAGMMKDTRLTDLEEQLNDEKLKNSQLLDRISVLEAQNDELSKALTLASPNSQKQGTTSEEARKKAIEELKKKAEDLQSRYDTQTGGGK